MRYLDENQMCRRAMRRSAHAISITNLDDELQAIQLKTTTTMEKKELSASAPLVLKGSQGEKFRNRIWNTDTHTHKIHAQPKRLAVG